MSRDSLTRRECLRRGAGAVFSAAAAATAAVWLHDPAGPRDGRYAEPHAGDKSKTPVGLPNYLEKIDLSPSSPRLSIAVGEAVDHSASPSAQDYAALTHRAVSALDPDLGIRRFIARDDVVLIKPNVGFDRPPALGATAHPDVVAAVVRFCRDAGAREVLLTDYPIESTQACFERSGITRAATEAGAKIIWPRDSLFDEIRVRDHRPDPARGEAFDRWPLLAAPLRRATKLIGIAPIKDHNLAGGSMCLKNWYGLLGGRRNLLHQMIHETISDLALLFSPTLVIADATRVMLANGPTGGRLVDVRPGGALGRPAVVASVDPVACDAWCYENLLARDPATLPYLRLAQQKIAAQIEAGGRRLGNADWREYHRQGLIARSDAST